MSDNNIFFDMVLSFEAIMNKKISKIVGARIKMLRQQHGMTGSELGALLGVSQQHQSRFENGECNIHVDVIYLLS
ncbi:helix-turn-helix domain-containing protein, partial [Proteus mirabilis]